MPPASQRHLRAGAVSTLAVALALGACADEPTNPTPLTSGTALQAAASRESVPAGLVPNGVPYRNPDYKHATGRDGGASLSARALKNKDGTTDFEVTTGVLDGGAPPNEMTKLQVKYITPDDEVQWTKNESRVGTGYKSFVFDGDLARHAFLQAQANITVPNASGKGHRTGVVTLRERINLRPDLAVTQLSGPGRVVVNTPAMFSAVFRELNGDLSARSSCVFYLDGQEVARTDNLFVAEGDAVDCLMNGPLTEVGTHTLTVSIENVVPGDYDVSNNTRAVTVEVVDPIHQLEGSASASEDHYRYYYSGGYNIVDNQSHSTSATFYGYADHPLTFPTSLSVTQSTGESVLDQVDLSDWGDPSASCNTHLTATSTVDVCSTGTGTTVNISRSTGKATYYTVYQHWHDTSWSHCHSSGWWGGCDWHRHYQGYYHPHGTSSEETWGTGPESLEARYTFDVRLEDSGNHTFKSDPVDVPLTPYDRTLGNERWWGFSGAVSFGGS